MVKHQLVTCIVEGKKNNVRLLAQYYLANANTTHTYLVSDWLRIFREIFKFS